MKNIEYYKEKILDIVGHGDSVGVDRNTNEPEGCAFLGCENCKLLDNCNNGLRGWCNEEYIEKPQITENDKKFLDIVNPKFKYIVKDRDNILCLSMEMPFRGENHWIGVNSCEYISENCFNGLFRFIKWDDEEPWRLDDLKKLEICE